MARTLPALGELAEATARELDGSAAVLDSGTYGSAAIAVGGRFALLLRDHVWSLTMSLPTRGSWRMQTTEEWRAALPAIRIALAGAHPFSIADAVVALAPILARSTGGPWSVRYPGGPVPSEAWMAHGPRSVGLFQKSNGVMLIVWAGGKGARRTVSQPSAIRELAPWLAASLAAQSAALAAETAERARQAALPLPDRDAVLALLRSGVRVQAGGGRCSETFFWDGRLRRNVFDEGMSFEEDATETQLQQHIELHAQAFRKALGMD